MKRVLQSLLALTLVAAGVAQEPSTKKESSDTRPQQKIYKVNFLIYELEDGKRINERSYSLPVKTQEGRPSTIKVGDRLPIMAKEGQTQYFDVGLSIDCNVNEQADKVIVSSNIEISSIISPEQAGTEVPHAGGNPVVRRVWQYFMALVTPGKPTLVTSIDDINSKKRLQVEVTATRLD